MTRRQQLTLAVCGVLALAGLGMRVWQRQAPPLTLEDSPEANPPVGFQTRDWDRRLTMAQEVDVNTANARELERLPGVGPVLARRIVEYRTAHGPFSSPEELSQVDGIGPKTYETLEDYVTTK